MCIVKCEWSALDIQFLSIKERWMHSKDMKVPYLEDKDQIPQLKVKHWR